MQAAHSSPQTKLDSTASKVLALTFDWPYFNHCLSYTMLTAQ